MSESDAVSDDARPGGGEMPVKALGVWATFGWAALVFVVSQAVGAAIVIAWFSGAIPPSVSAGRYEGTLVALVTLITNPVQIALLAAIARWRSGSSAADYLGLTAFSGRDFFAGLLATAGLAAAIDLATHFAGLDVVSPFQTDAFTSARETGWVWPLMLAIVVVGPAGEEIMFRGFLFRGWVTPDARGVFAVVVITLMWSLMHVQYDWFGIGQVFLTGLVLGWIRWRSGSTWLTMILHVLVNLASMIETLVKLGWSVV
jgi:hypothetical protein